MIALRRCLRAASGVGAVLLLAFAQTAVCEKGLVASYSFGKGLRTEVHDDSGNGCHGGLRGGTAKVEGRFGKCLKFDGKHGSNALIADKAILQITDELSVSFWFRCDGFPIKEKGWRTAKVDCATLFGKGWNWEVRIYPDGRLRASVLTVDPTGEKAHLASALPSPRPVQLHQWRHLAYVYSVAESRFTLYVDGTKAAESTEDIHRLRDDRTIMFGESPASWNPFTGCLDEVRIYNRAVPVEELCRISMEAVQGRIASWKGPIDSLHKRARALKPLTSTPVQDLAALEQQIGRMKGRSDISLSTYAGVESELRSLATLILTLEEHGTNLEDCLCYVVRPIVSKMVLPCSSLPSEQLGTTLRLVATPGEYEPASFVLRPLKDVESLTLKPTPLSGAASIIPAASIDIRGVKCWYQAGTAWYGMRQSKSTKVLVPELLLHDDSLVKVDYENQENYLKYVDASGKEGYLWISDPAYERQSGYPTMTTIPSSKFPVRDRASLQPIDIDRRTARQFWVTVRVPEDARPGLYEGKLNVSAEEGRLGEIALKLRVLPFKLAAPKTYYDLRQDFISSIYYHGYLLGTGQLDRFRKECENLVSHGVTNPFICYQNLLFEHVERFREAHQIKVETGIQTKPLFFIGQESNLRFGYPKEPAKLEALKTKVREAIARVKQVYGHGDVYFYGCDEARGDRLKAQRPAWQAVREAGGKVFVSGYTAGRAPPGNVALVGDLQDLIICALGPSKEEAAKWHSRGHKIFCYANPQAGPENPETWRRNFGVLLWKANYDGAATYLYYGSCGGNPWNDFDHPRYRDHNFVYPTLDGVIDTIAWEGYREGVDDIRYGSTLRLEIEKAERSGNTEQRRVARRAAGYLDELDASKVNLDTMRLEMVNYILELKGAN